MKFLALLLLTLFVSVQGQELKQKEADSKFLKIKVNNPDFQIEIDNLKKQYDSELNELKVQFKKQKKSLRKSYRKLLKELRKKYKKKKLKNKK